MLELLQLMNQSRREEAASERHTLHGEIHQSLLLLQLYLSAHRAYQRACSDCSKI